MYNHSFFFISEMCTLSISGFSQTSFDIFSIVTLIKPVRYMIPASFTQYDAILVTRSTVISLMTFVRQFVANFTEPCSHPVPHARSVITNDL